jgi:hypothetical protein
MNAASLRTAAAHPVPYIFSGLQRCLSFTASLPHLQMYFGFSPSSFSLRSDFDSLHIFAMTAP